MIGYISLVNNNGKTCWMQADEIAAFNENETKVGQDTVPCTSVLLRNNVSWHFPGVTGAQMVALMRSCSGSQVNVITVDDL